MSIEDESGTIKSLLLIPGYELEGFKFSLLLSMCKFVPLYTCNVKKLVDIKGFMFSEVSLFVHQMIN